MIMVNEAFIDDDCQNFTESFQFQVGDRDLFVLSWKGVGSVCV